MCGTSQLYGYEGAESFRRFLPSSSPGTKPLLRLWALRSTSSPGIPISRPNCARRSRRSRASPRSTTSKPACRTWVLSCVKREPITSAFFMVFDYRPLVHRLRLYPGLPYIERVATVPDVIPLGVPVKLSTGEAVSQIPVSPGQVSGVSCVIALYARPC